MADRTGIAWTRSTFNPWIGCTEVSPGCDGCYARELDKRHRYGGATHWGAGTRWRQTLPMRRTFCASNCPEPGETQNERP